jgi:hypothetical protein
MAGATTFKITKFLGEAPKLSPEDLPDTVAQFAYNTKLYSGDLIPFRKSSVAATLDKPGTILTVFPLKSPTDGSLKWLHWTTDVDVATGQIANDTTQRTYYTGDSEPRVTNYALATSGAMFPTQYYTLGLPYPQSAPVASVVSYPAIQVTTVARDSGNIATITTASPHMLTTGAWVTVSGLVTTAYLGFNLTNVQVTATSATTLTFYSYGTAQASVSVTGTDPAAVMNIAGLTVPRSYVYTWFTAWGEESAPSPASATVFLKEGQQVTLSGLPTSMPTTGVGYAAVSGAPAPVFQTAGMQLKIYRTIASTSGTNYFYLGSVTLGATSTFTDNFDYTTLSTALLTTYYDPPHSRVNTGLSTDTDMQGMLAVHNGMMVGFFGNTVCFCEPGQPHAWPIKYRKQVDAQIVGIGNVGVTIVVATTGKPWLITGNYPSAMFATKTDFVLPCVSKRSLVNMGYGVVYASPGGLAMYSASSGGSQLTEHVHSWDTWQSFGDYTQVYGAFYQNRYFGTNGNASFMFEKQDQIGGYLVESNTTFSAARYVSLNDAFYYVVGSTVYRWDDPAQPNGLMDWKSKVFVLKDYCNLGVSRIVADYDTSGNNAQVAVFNTNAINANQATINLGKDMGSMGTAYAGAAATVEPLIALLPISAQVTFQLYVNKKLVFTRVVVDSNPFRLPATYRSDTFEMRVSTDLRVRAIHVAETLIGLKRS